MNNIQNTAPYFVFLGFILFLTSCTNKYRIDGVASVPGFDGRVLYLKVFRNNQMVTIDSSEVVHGTFNMRGEVDSVELVNVYLNDEPIIPLVLENGNISIRINDSDVKVQGTKLNNALYDFLDKKKALDLQIENIKRKEARLILDGELYDEIRNKLNEESVNAVNKMQVYVKNFIKENSDNVLGPTIFLLLGNSTYYPMITPLMDEILKDASPSFKNDVRIKEFLKVAHENNMTVNGIAKN